MRVLYVEDDITVAKTVQLMLEGEGYACDTIKSGVRAVALTKREEYDLILLDLMLPDIDGYEVIKRVREAGIRTPFLILSGLAGDQIKQVDPPLGVSEHLVKPFNKDDLIDRIQSVVSRANGQEADGQEAEEPGVQADAGEDLQGSDDDRREHRRFETTMPARILHGDGLDCVILNMSYGGAKIQLADAEVDLPPAFDLQVAFGSTFRCTASWRFQDKVGVRAEALKPEAFLAVPPNEAGSGPSDDPAPVQSDQDDSAPAPVDAGGDALAPVQSEPDDDEPVPPAEPQPAMDTLPSREPEPAEADRDAPWPIQSEPGDDEPVPPAGHQPAMGGPPAQEPAAAESGGDASAPEPPNSVEAPGLEQDQTFGSQVFVVDHGVCLDAESCECGVLLVKGRFQGSLRADRLELAEGAQFVGDATVGFAEIAGAFDGDLVVAGKLVIRATGSVSGSARYDEIIIEPGGRIVGEIQSASNEAAAQSTAGTASERDGAPRHGIARSA